MRGCWGHWRWVSRSKRLAGSCRILGYQPFHMEKEETHFLLEEELETVLSGCGWEEPLTLGPVLVGRF